MAVVQLTSWASISAQASVQSAVRTAFCAVPVVNYACSHPISSWVPFPARTKHDEQASVPDYLHLVTLQGKFEEILEPTSGGALAFSIQLTKIALRDLSVAVTSSGLPGQKELALRINTFVTDARITEHNVRSFASRLGGAVDRSVIRKSSMVSLLTGNLPPAYSR